MIESTLAPAFPTLAGAAAPAASKSPAGTFDDALKAATKAAQRQEEDRRELEAIRQKGFRDWARDAEVAKLKEKLRQMVLAEMGLDEQALGAMEAAVRQVLEQKIADEIERRLSETLAGEAERPVHAADDQAPGKKCPVIPGLVWPGGASVL